MFQGPSDFEAKGAVRWRCPGVPDRPGRATPRGRERRFARFRSRGKKINGDGTLFSLDGRSRCECVVFRRHRGGRLVCGRSGTNDRRRGDRVPRARREFDEHGTGGRVGNDEFDIPRRSGGNLPDRKRFALAGLRELISIRSHGLFRQIDHQAVFPNRSHRFNLHVVARRRLGRVAAVEMHPDSRGHIGVCGQGQHDFVLARRQDIRIHVDVEVRAGVPPDHGPSQRRAGRFRVDPRRRHLGAPRSRRRIPNDDPFDVVHVRGRGVLPACRHWAVAALVEPQIQIVEDRAGDGVRRWLVPRHNEVEAARIRRHIDVDETVLAVRKDRHRAPARPAVGLITVEDSSACRRPAHAVLRLQGPGPTGVVGRENGFVGQPRVGTYRARHEPRPRQRRLFAICRCRVQQQRRHACGGRRRHACAVENRDSRLDSRSLARNGRGCPWRPVAASSGRRPMDRGC